MGGGEPKTSRKEKNLWVTSKAEGYWYREWEREKDRPKYYNCVNGELNHLGRWWQFFLRSISRRTLAEWLYSEQKATAAELPVGWLLQSPTSSSSPPPRQSVTNLPQPPTVGQSTTHSKSNCKLGIQPNQQKLAAETRATHVKTPAEQLVNVKVVHGVCVCVCARARVYLCHLFFLDFKFHTISIEGFCFILTRGKKQHNFFHWRTPEHPP